MSDKKYYILFVNISTTGCPLYKKKRHTHQHQIFNNSANNQFYFTQNNNHRGDDQWIYNTVLQQTNKQTHNHKSPVYLFCKCPPCVHTFFLEEPQPTVKTQYKAVIKFFLQQKRNISGKILCYFNTLCLSNVASKCSLYYLMFVIINISKIYEKNF